MSLDLPEKYRGQTILLHSCCAPCSCAVMQRLVEHEMHVTVLYYNPNIHPIDEYVRRKEENKIFAIKNNVQFVDLDYEPQEWFAGIAGLEHEPERGKRCTVCFSLRFERTALYAHEEAIPLFTSSLGMSRWKNFDQITACGKKAASLFPNVHYWDINWRKGGMQERRKALVTQEKMYQQDYCGCIFSQRNNNHGT